MDEIHRFAISTRTHARPRIHRRTHTAAQTPNALHLLRVTCRSYIAAAFVKWIEAAGGRPVPIRFYASEQELHRLFKQINGLVFPVRASKQQ